MPGYANTVSVSTAPESSSPTCRPMIVVTGSSAFRITCRGRRCSAQAPSRARCGRSPRSGRRAPTARVMRVMIASGIEPSAIAGRIRCLSASQNAPQFAGDDRVEDVEVRRMLGRRSARRSRPTRRQPAEPHGEDVLEDQREEEDRHRDAEQRDDERPVVEAPPVALRARRSRAGCRSRPRRASPRPRARPWRGSARRSRSARSAAS